MNKDIIRMAREAGAFLEPVTESDAACLECFAQLVASQEREECAKILDANAEVCASVMKDILLANADAIRARNN